MISNNIIGFKVSTELLQKSFVEKNNIIIHEDPTSPNCIFYLNGRILGVITEHDYYGNVLQNILKSVVKKILYVNDKLNILSEDDSKFFVGTMQELNALCNGN